MSRTGRTSVLILMIAVLVAGFSTSVMGAEEGGEGGTGGEGTSTTISSGLSPAVEVAPDETAPPQADWTYRYIVPTALALAAVIVLITAIKYFTDVVRKRYRIVEE
jgi:hypothetical protein